MATQNYVNNYSLKKKLIKYEQKLLQPKKFWCENSKRVLEWISYKKNFYSVSIEPQPRIRIEFLFLTC